MDGSEELPRTVRLALVKHAANDHPEPGSNSPKKYKFTSAKDVDKIITTEGHWPSQDRQPSSSPVHLDLKSRQTQKIDVSTHTHSSLVKVQSRLRAANSADTSPRTD